MSGARGSSPPTSSPDAATAGVVRDAVLVSLFGPFRIEVDDDGRLVRADFIDGAPGATVDDATSGRDPAADVDPRPDEPARHPALARAVDQLTAYFAGTPTTFDLPVAPRGTDFERRVWDHLATIPYGRTTTYGAVAAAIGEPPEAARAVGVANARNPIAVVIPCHRVIGADGSLVGYAAGIERKRGLLALEQGQPMLPL